MRFTNRGNINDKSIDSLIEWLSLTFFPKLTRGSITFISWFYPLLWFEVSGEMSRILAGVSCPSIHTHLQNKIHEGRKTDILKEEKGVETRGLFALRVTFFIPLFKWLFSWILEVCRRSIFSGGWEKMVMFIASEEVFAGITFCQGTRRPLPLPGNESLVRNKRVMHQETSLLTRVLKLTPASDSPVQGILFMSNSGHHLVLRR